MTPQRFAIVGAGGHARAVTDVIERLGACVVLRIAPDASGPGSIRDEEEGLTAARDGGLPVLLGVGDNAARLQLARRALDLGALSPPVVAATATVHPGVELGAGTVVMEHAHVGPGAHVGLAVLVNTAAVVEHDCELGDGVHCAPGSVLAGAARIGTGTMLGVGARVLPGRRVGAGTVVGAGAIITREHGDGVRIIGVDQLLG